MPLILRFVGEQTDTIGHLLFCVEFSMWGVCGIYGNKVGRRYPPKPIALPPVSSSRIGEEGMKRGDKMTQLLKHMGQAITC